jgi:hypothetical protein
MLTQYVSEIDQFLQEFDKQHPQLTQSQQKEQAKYRRIYRLRDTTDQAEATSKLWEGF